MKAAPAFQFYAADWLADIHVSAMTSEQEGVYIRLLAHCWREGSLPNDDEVLSAIAKGASTTVLSVVRKRFVIDANDTSKLVHLRLEEERQKQRQWREKSVEGGKKSAETRRKQRTKRQLKGGSTVVQPPYEPNVNSSSSSSSSYKNSPPTPSPESNANALQTQSERNAELFLIRSQAASRAAQPPDPRTAVRSPETEAEARNCEAFSEWALAVYEKHPKRKNRFLSLEALRQAFAEDPPARLQYETQMRKWARYWEQHPEEKKFVSPLCSNDGSGWIPDGTWETDPPFDSHKPPAERIEPDPYRDLDAEYRKRQAARSGGGQR